MEKDIVIFYGRECPHCHAMMPLVEKLEKETGIKVEKLEVWHSEENASEMRKYADVIKPACGGSLGVPTFLHLETKGVLCGETDYATFKSWAQKQKK
jgi:thiol-disulfide isomerase/thioredoxin